MFWKGILIFTAVLAIAESVAELECDDDEFKCLDGRQCIKFWSFCDGSAQCRDRSDEIDPTNASFSGFPCRKMSNNCMMPTDQGWKLKMENQGFFPWVVTCDDNEFKCLDGTSCKSWLFCDGKVDCRDGSDEIHPNNTTIDGALCHQDSHVCKLPANQAEKVNTLCRRNPSCDKNEFRCLDGSRCIPASGFCDESCDCRDSSDKEIDFDGRKPLSGIHYRTCLLPSEYICTGQKFIETGKDELLCSNDIRGTKLIYLDERNFRCLSMNEIISVGNLCDGYIDCPDLTDECLCPKRIRICHGVKWNFTKVVGVKKHNFRGIVYCSNSSSRLLTAVTLSQVCNGKSDCESGEDERFCTNDCNSLVGQASHPCLDYDCSSYGGGRATACDGFPTCAYRSYDEECGSRCRDKPKFCENFKGKHKVFPCNGSTTALSSYIGIHKICDGKVECYKMKDEIECPHRHYCKAKDLISIPDRKKCDQIPDCDDGSDEPENCSFACKDSGEVKFIPIIKICDGTENCKGGSDECQSGCIKSSFSDINSMIKEKVFVVFAWLISLPGLIGNIIVIGWSVMQFWKRSDLTTKEKVSKGLILNLSISDLVVSAFTFSICIKASFESEKYCLYDRKWRSSVACSALGSLMVIGSEESVLTMVLITLLRSSTVTKYNAPSKWRMYLFLTVMTWITSVLLAVFPLTSAFEDHFVDSIWYEDNKLFATIDSKDVEYLTYWLLMMHNNSAVYGKEFGQIGSWSRLQFLIKGLNPNLTVGRTFGFYSTHAVCLPTIFPNRQTDTAWWYTMILIGINFFAFVAIFFGGIVIYKSATKKNVLVNESKLLNKRAAKLRNKLTRIVATDFFCWIPVCIMAFLQVSGINIPNDVYLPTAIIILPINSMLNPILYSDAPEKFWATTQPLRAWIYHILSSIGARLYAPLFEKTEHEDPNEDKPDEGNADKEEVEYQNRESQNPAMDVEQGRISLANLFPASSEDLGNKEKGVTQTSV